MKNTETAVTASDDQEAGEETGENGNIFFELEELNCEIH